MGWKIEWKVGFWLQETSLSRNFININLENINLFSFI